METLEELPNDGRKISRVDTIPPTELPTNAVSATNVYILEKSEDTEYARSQKRSAHTWPWQSSPSP